MASVFLLVFLCFVVCSLYYNSGSRVFFASTCCSLDFVTVLYSLMLCIGDKFISSCWFSFGSINAYVSCFLTSDSVSLSCAFSKFSNCPFKFVILVYFQNLVMPALVDETLDLDGRDSSGRATRKELDSSWTPLPSLWRVVEIVGILSVCFSCNKYESH